MSWSVVIGMWFCAYLGTYLEALDVLPAPEAGCPTKTTSPASWKGSGEGRLCLRRRRRYAAAPTRRSKTRSRWNAEVALDGEPGYRPGQGRPMLSGGGGNIGWRRQAATCSRSPSGNLEVSGFGPVGCCGTQAEGARQGEQGRPGGSQQGHCPRQPGPGARSLIERSSGAPRPSPTYCLRCPACSGGLHRITASTRLDLGLFCRVDARRNHNTLAMAVGPAACPHSTTPTTPSR